VGAQLSADGRESSKPPRRGSYQKNPGGTKTRTGSANQFNRGTAPSYTGARPRRHAIVKGSRAHGQSRAADATTKPDEDSVPGSDWNLKGPAIKIPPSRGTRALRKSRL